MSSEALKILHHPDLRDASLILGFSGWMDGGEVSTGATEYLVEKLEAIPVAEIDPDPFYIMNFPGSMEVAALFRPHVAIEDGLITHLDEPRSAFHCAPRHNLVLFTGREPNLRWGDFSDCIFKVVAEFGVARVFFVGSVAGLVPHTRDPRVFSSVSLDELMPQMRRLGCLPSGYEGPGSFVTSLTVRARERGVPLATLVSEVPAYVQGRNPKCIEAVLRKLAALTNSTIDIGDLAAASREFEERLNGIVNDKPELAEMIQKMEADYDQAVSQTADADLKAWLERQGIRLD